MKISGAKVERNKSIVYFDIDSDDVDLLAKGARIKVHFLCEGEISAP